MVLSYVALAIQLAAYAYGLYLGCTCGQTTRLFEGLFKRVRQR
jgi:hypothetical protein